MTIMRARGSYGNDDSGSEEVGEEGGGVARGREGSHFSTKNSCWVGGGVAVWGSSVG